MNEEKAYTIRRLAVGEAELYRSIRLEALRESPEAFCSSYDAALGRDMESWADQANAASEGGDRAIFVVQNDEPVGLVALYRDPENSSQGELVQMWIAPSAERRYRGGFTEPSVRVGGGAFLRDRKGRGDRWKPAGTPLLPEMRFCRSDFRCGGDAFHQASCNGRTRQPGEIRMKLDYIQLAMPKGGEEKAQAFFSGVLGMEEQEKHYPLRSERGGCWFRNGSIRETVKKASEGFLS